MITIIETQMDLEMRTEGERQHVSLLHNIESLWEVYDILTSARRDAERRGKDGFWLYNSDNKRLTVILRKGIDDINHNLQSYGESRRRLEIDFEKLRKEYEYLLANKVADYRPVKMKAI